jgi:hypothetical protein
LVAWAVMIDVTGNNSDYLAAHGVAQPGVITAVEGTWVPFADGSVQVSYHFGGRTFHQRVWLDDSTPSYQAGQAVTVTLDPKHPGNVTVGGSDNTYPVVTDVMMLLLVGGIVAMPWGLVWLSRVQRCRSIATSYPWRPARVSYRLQSAGERMLYFCRLETEPGQPVLRVASSGLPAWRPDPFTIEEVQVAGDAAKAVLIHPHPAGGVALAVPPRTHRSALRWRRRFI